MVKGKYILTLSCKDTMGIVAAVSGFLAENGGFILESSQFGDASTSRFFMRVEFEAEKNIKDLFAPIAEKFAMKWDIFDMQIRPRVLILVSRAGHCLNNLLYRYEAGSLPVDIRAVVSNHKDLKPMAKRHGVDFKHLPITADTRKKQEAELWKIIEKQKTDVVVLARYMQVLSVDLCEKLKGKAINIHHSFLPGFKGANPYKQAYDRGVKIIGATAHYVTTDLDEGPIIEQEVIRVEHTDTPDALKSLGQDIEARVLARALKYHIEHRVILNGNKTVIFK